jgi:uncharacterized protein
MGFSVENGTNLIRFARENITNFLETGKRINIPDNLKEKFKEKGGAFVTLNKMSGSGDTSLRGCIGIIMPHYPLIETVHNISISSAMEDPRFPEVKISEMEKIIIEISILSVPEKIIVKDPQEYLNKIVIGRDGLIVTRGRNRGLLLPQVPIDHDRNWDPKTFLEHTCQKAWLKQDAWKDIEKVTIESFTATIFEETSPNGPVKEKAIGE